MHRRAPMPQAPFPSRRRTPQGAIRSTEPPPYNGRRRPGGNSSLREKIVLPEAPFWKRYRDLEEVAAETRPEVIVEILKTFAAAHQKHIYLFQRFRSTILRNLDKFDAPALASICHSFVVVGFLREELVVALVPRVIETAHLCTASDLCHLLDAYASLRSSHPDLLQKVTAETFRLLRRFTVSELATHISSFARLNAHSHRLFCQVANRLLELDRALCRYEKNVQNLTTDSTFMSSSSSSHRGDDFNNDGNQPIIKDEAYIVNSKDNSNNINEIKASLMEEAIKSVDCAGPLEFTARDLTLSAYAFAKLGLYIEDIFELISRRGSMVARDFTAHQIQMVAVAYHRANLRDLVFLGRLSQQAQRRMAQFNAESIALLMRTYALFGIRDLSLFTRIVAQLPRLILTFRPLDIATTLNAFAKLDICSCALLAVAFPHILAEQAKFSSADLQSVLHACARLGVLHPMFLEMLVNRCDPSQLNICQIATLLTDLATLAYFELPFVIAVFTEALYSTRFTLSPPVVYQLLTAAIYLKIDSIPEGKIMLNMLLAQAQRELKSKKPYKSTNPTNAHAQLQSPVPMGALLASLAYALCCWSETNNITQYDIINGDSDHNNIPHPAELLRPALDRIFEDNNIKEGSLQQPTSTSTSYQIHETLKKLNLAIFAVRARDDVVFKAPEQVAFVSKYKLAWPSLTGEIVRGAEKETFLGLQDIACAFIKRLQISRGIVIYYNLPPEELMEDAVDISVAKKKTKNVVAPSTLTPSAVAALNAASSTKDYVAVVKGLAEDPLSCPFLLNTPWHCFLSLPLRAVRAAAAAAAATTTADDGETTSNCSSSKGGGIYRCTQSDMMYSGGGCRSASSSSLTSSIDDEESLRQDYINDSSSTTSDGGGGCCGGHHPEGAHYCHMKTLRDGEEDDGDHDFYGRLLNVPEPLETTGPKLLIFWASPLHYQHNRDIVHQLRLGELAASENGLTEQEALHHAIHLYLELQYTPAAQMQWKLTSTGFPVDWQRIVIPSYCWTVCRWPQVQEDFLMLLLNTPALQQGSGSGDLSICPICQI